MPSDVDRMQGMGVYSLFANRSFLGRPEMKKALSRLLKNPNAKFSIQDPEGFLTKKNGVLITVLAVWGRFKLKFKLLIIPSYPRKFNKAVLKIDKAFLDSCAKRVSNEFDNKVNPPKVPTINIKNFEELNKNYAQRKQTCADLMKEMEQLQSQLVVKTEAQESLNQFKFDEAKTLEEFHAKEMILAHAKAYSHADDKKILGMVFRKDYDLTEVNAILQKHKLKLDFKQIEVEIERYQKDIENLLGHLKKIEEYDALDLEVGQLTEEIKIKKALVASTVKEIESIYLQIYELNNAYDLGLPERPEFLNELKLPPPPPGPLNPHRIFQHAILTINRSIDQEETTYEAKVHQREAQLLYMEKSVSTKKLVMGGFDDVELSKQKMALVLKTLSEAMCEPENGQKISQLMVDMFRGIVDRCPEVTPEEKEEISGFIRFVFGLNENNEPNLNEGYRYRLILFLFISGICLPHYFYDPDALESSFKYIKKLEGGGVFKRVIVEIGTKLFQGKVNQIVNSIGEVPFLKTNEEKKKQADTFIRVFLPIGKVILFGENSGLLKSRLRQGMSQYANEDYKIFMDQVSFKNPITTTQMTDAFATLFNNFVANLNSNEN